MRMNISTSCFLPLPALSFALMLLGSQMADAQQSANIVPTLSASVRVNKVLTLGAQLSDAWDGAVLPGRLVNVQIGDRYSLASTYFNSDGSGRIAHKWTFQRTGRYRITFKFNGDGRYLDTRTTVFVTVTP